jgi:hypothetical protein
VSGAPDQDLRAPVRYAEVDSLEAAPGDDIEAVYDDLKVFILVDGVSVSGLNAGVPARCKCGAANYDLGRIRSCAILAWDEASTGLDADRQPQFIRKNLLFIEDVELLLHIVRDEDHEDLGRLGLARVLIHNPAEGVYSDGIFSG